MERLQKLLTGTEARTIARWGLRAVGPVVLVVLLVRVVDYGELRKLFGDIRIGWLVAALATVQLIHLFRTLRWIDLHSAFGLPRASLVYQLRLTYATSLATLVLPQIVNPLSRFVLMVQDGYRAGRTAAGSVAEKVLELASYVAFGVYGSIVLASTFGGLVWWAAGVALASLVAGAALYAGRSHVRRMIEALIERMPGIAGGERERAEVAHEVVSMNSRVVARLSIWSFLVCMAQATMLYFLTRSLGVDLSYGFMVAVWGVIAFSFLLPLSVNGVGTREAILVAAFKAVDESTDAAVAIGLLTLAVVAAGSAPGAVEWLRRFFAGSGTPAPADAQAAAPIAQPQGGQRP